MPPEPAQRRVGPFQLNSKLGVGGMGVVYEATYLKTGQKVALKMLAPDLTADPKVAKRFEREMEILQKLKHPNIIRYYGGSSSGNQRWYAMELIAGGSMDRIIRDKGCLDWEAVIDYGIQIAMALEHAHAAGVVHRDLKPANLLLTSSNTIKLTDFGIARDSDATALTQAGKTVGTMAYMAPEQITGKHPISRKTDLYALGCVLYEMLTGKTPFDAPTQPEMLFKHLDEAPPSVREIAWQTPVWLDELIEELLAKDPNDRPFDALAVQVKLADVRKKVDEKKTTFADAGSTRKGATVQGDAVVTRMIGQKKKKKKQATPVWERWWFLTALLVMLVAGVTWAVWPESEEVLFARVQTEILKEKFSDDNLLRAEPDLKRLKSRFPEGAHAAQVTEWLGAIDGIMKGRRVTTRLNLGHQPSTEGERLLLEAQSYEKRGDRLSAIEKYQAMQTVLANSVEDAPIRNLARHRKAQIEAQFGSEFDRPAFVNGLLKQADDAWKKAQTSEAREIWTSVIKLYGHIPEFQPQADEASRRLDEAEKTLRGTNLK